MKWKKLGRLYAHDPIHPKLLSHAANPLPVRIEEDLYRVFFSSRDESNRSSVGCVDIDLARREVIRVHPLPAFEHGPKGSFYEGGVSIGNCYEAGGSRYILFMGWQNPEGGHWRGDIGRLLLDPDDSLRLESDSPFLASDEVDPLSLSYPWVEPVPDGGFRMWYGSTLTWDAGNGEMVHVIHGANSADGDRWTKEGLAVPYRIGVAQAFSRPTAATLPDGNRWMWFSYRSGTGVSYRIGCAKELPDGAWDLRLNETGIEVSPEGWDSEMIEYPFVLRHEKDFYLFYNGNGYGKTGFGIAMLEDL